MMIFRNKLLLCVLILFIVSTIVYGQSHNSFDANSNIIYLPDLNHFFTNYTGCFIMFDIKENSYTIYNKNKCIKRISPCSTFKVIHSLIALETKVIEDEHVIFKWDGTVYPIKEWNQDLDMATAIRLSAFWYYQIIAKKIGRDRMQSYLSKIKYGNTDISGGMAQFWQQSSLSISPKEQVDILTKVYLYDVPFSKRNVDILKKIIYLDEKDSAKIYGKTGSGYPCAGFIPRPGDEIVNGWFIGFVEKAENAYIFATNIEAKKDALGYKAKQITLEILNYLTLY